MSENRFDDLDLREEPPRPAKLDDALLATNTCSQTTAPTCRCTPSV